MDYGSNGYNSERGPSKDHSIKVWSQMVKLFQSKRFFIVFPIGSYVKTMSADGGHLGWTSGPTDTILKGDHPRTIPSEFSPHWSSCFRQEDFSLFFP